MKNFQQGIFGKVPSLFFPEFSTLDSNPQSQGNISTGISIFPPFKFEISGGILFISLAGAVYIYSILLGRMDAHTASLAETKLLQPPVFTRLSSTSTTFQQHFNSTSQHFNNISTTLAVQLRLRLVVRGLLTIPARFPAGIPP